MVNVYDFWVGNQVPVPPSPGRTLPVTCGGKRFGVELFEKNRKTHWIQERDRIHWQYVCINMYTYLEPKWLKWLFFCFWKRLLADKLKGKRNYSFGPHQAGFHHILAAHALGHLVSLKAGFICIILGKYHLAEKHSNQQPASAVLKNGPSVDPSCTVAHPDPGPKNTEVFDNPPALRQLWKKSLFVDYW